jgi:hypothetical protein
MANITEPSQMLGYQASDLKLIVPELDLKTLHFVLERSDLVHQIRRLVA